MINYFHALQQLIVNDSRVNNDLLIRVVIIKVYFVLCYKYDPIFYDFVNEGYSCREEVVGDGFV